MTLKDSLRDAQVINKDGYPYLIHPLTDGVPRIQPDLLREWVAWAAPRVQGATLLVAPEAMALPLATALALETGIPFVCVRKRAYGLPGEVAAYAETGYSHSTLHVNDVGRDDTVVVIEDVLSTGGTLGGVLGALKATDCQVLTALVLLDKGVAAASLEAKTGIHIQAMHRARVSARGVELA